MRRLILIAAILFPTLGISQPPPNLMFVNIDGTPTAVQSDLTTGQLGYDPPSILAKCKNGALTVDCDFSGSSSGSGPVLLTGATSRFDMLPAHISGSTLQDQSGSGNNGTFSPNPPTSIPAGLVFAINTGVSLPAALNTTRTFVVGIYIPPLPSNNTNYTAGFGSIYGASQGTSGYSFLNAYSSSNTFFGQNDLFAPSSFAGGAFAAACNLWVTGYHVYAVTLGTNTSTDPDVLYLDGQPCQTNSTVASASSGVMSAGNYYLGAPIANTFANQGFIGTMYFAETFSTELTPANVSSESGSISAIVASRGVPTTPQRVIPGTPTLIASGDSITFGFGLSPSAAWPFNLTLTNQSYSIRNLGITGVELHAISGSMSDREDTLCVNPAGPTVDILFAGTNDLVGTIFTPANTLTALAGAVQSAHKAGCVVGVGTMISRNGIDSLKDTYDALILTNWKSIGADFLVDFAADPRLGADGASLNPNPTACGGTTCFQGDATHPTATGQLVLASEASNALNYAFGSNAGNPNIVTSNTYQMLAGDGVITAAMTGNAAYTLPECAGQTGAIYTINNPQSTFTLSVVGLSASEPINGFTTAQTIPSNSTVNIRDVANPKTTAGCHWVM